MWQGFEAKLTPMATERMVYEVGWVDMPPWRHLHHGVGLLTHVKRQMPRLIPYRDGLHKITGRKLTVTDGTNSFALDAGTKRTGDTALEKPVFWIRKIGEFNNVTPYRLRGCVDFNDGQDFVFRWHTNERFGTR